VNVPNEVFRESGNKDIEDAPTGAKSTAEPAIQLLLQQHQSVLSRSVSSQVTYRVINAAIIALILIRPTGDGRALVPVAILLVSAVVAKLWSSEQQVLAKRLHSLERTLGRTGSMTFDDSYVSYQFEASVANTRYSILRLEPLVWFLVILASSAMLFVSPWLLRIV
jgi:hypothetical protein